MVSFSIPTHIYICTLIYMFYSTKVISTLLHFHPGTQMTIAASNCHWDAVFLKKKKKKKYWGLSLRTHFGP